MPLKSDCRHFPGDRPCRFNKAYGQICDDCPHYARAGKRILLIKLAAAGDVLRTTSLLPAIKQIEPDGFLVWLTSKRSVSLLEENPLIDEIWSVEDHAPTRLMAEQFDLVLNPDADKTSAALASLARAPEKRGLLLAARGAVICANPEAAHWLEMGAFDHLKKSNQRTYAELISEMLCLPHQRTPPSLCLRASEIQSGVKTLQEQGWSANVPLIGLNLGGGTRWKKKVWKEHHLLELGRRILNQTEASLLLVGGPFETELLRRIRCSLGRNDSRVLAAFGTTDRETAALIRCCRLLITGDTLCLHLATALHVPIVLLVGPTSGPELDLFDRGQKIIAPIGCVGCYLPDCDIDPDCMELIRPDAIFSAVAQELDRSGTDGRFDG